MYREAYTIYYICHNHLIVTSSSTTIDITKTISTTTTTAIVTGTETLSFMRDRLCKRYF